MPRKRTKKSIFCDKSPSTGVTNGIVWFKPEKLWRICKGKLYKNGYFRYYHNGQTAVVGPRNYKVIPDFSLEQLEEETQRLNLQVLEYGRPRPNPFRWRRVLREERPPVLGQELNRVIEEAVFVLDNANFPAETLIEETPQLLTNDQTDGLIRTPI